MPTPGLFDGMSNFGGYGGSGFSFNDPLTQQYEARSAKRMGELDQPVNNDALNQAIAALSGIAGGSGGGDNPGWGQFEQIANKRLGQLDQPGYSANQRDIMRTDYIDPLEGQRSAAKQQVLERLQKRGIDPSSGIAQQALMDVDRSFNEQRTTGDRAFSIDQMKQDEARKQEAVQIGQLLASLGAQTGSLRLQGQGQKLSAASGLGGLGLNQMQFNEGRKDNALGISKGLSDLLMQRYGAGLAGLNALDAPVPQDQTSAGLMQLLMGLANQGQSAGTNAANQSSAYWNALIQAIPGIAGAVGGMKTPSTSGGGRYG